jgi:Amidase
MSDTTTDLWRMSVMDLAAAIRSGQTSSQEVIESHLRRIEAVNPSINAVTVVLGEQALEAAKVADRVVAGGAEPPPFHGVPFTVGKHRPRGYANHCGTQSPCGRVSGSGRPGRRADACCRGDPDRPHQLS